MPSVPTDVLRSTAAKAVVAVAILAVGGVAAAQIGVLDEVVGQDDASSLDQVPDGVDSVTTLDASVLEDDVARRLYATAYDATAGAATDGTRDGESDVTATPAEDDAETDEADDESGTDAVGDDPFGDDGLERASPAEMVPANLTAALDAVENRSGLDPRAADEVVFFNKQRENFTQPQYAGAIVHAEWSESAVVAAASNSSDTAYEETTVDGVTVYQPVENESEDEDEPSFGPPEPEQWIAVLDDGEYVFGTEQAVTDTIQVAVGDADPVDGDLRSAFEGTRDGFVRYAQRSQNVNVTRINQTLGQRTGLNVTAYAEAYNDLHVTSGSYYLTDESVGVETRTLTNSTDTARDVQDLTQGFISIQAGAIQNETIESELRSTNVTRDGTTVTVTRETSIETVEMLVRWYGSILTGSAQATGAAAQPAGAGAQPTA